MSCNKQHWINSSLNAARTKPNNYPQQLKLRKPQMDLPFESQGKGHKMLQPKAKRVNLGLWMSDSCFLSTGSEVSDSSRWPACFYQTLVFIEAIQNRILLNVYIMPDQTINWNICVQVNLRYSKEIIWIVCFLLWPF